jgi:hypothetical protein
MVKLWIRKWKPNSIFLSKFESNFEIRIRHLWSNFVPGRIFFELRPRLVNCTSIALGPCQTSDFVTKAIFFWQNIAISFQNQLKYPWIEIFNSHGEKILPEKCHFIAILLYLFIAILLVKIAHLTRAIKW